MNFFEQQDRARKWTFVLLFFYALAVIATILAVYWASRISWYLYLAYRSAYTGYSTSSDSVSFQFWEPRIFFIVTLTICGIVLAGAALKISELSSGGAAVARMLGGEQIMPNTTDLDERKVLNVVEEMAIASGVPVPPVFILKNEYGINAFAAGFSIRDVAIGITKGAVKLLSRDELQGVIAHEFSHIFNGDMRLNMNLTGFLNGLLLIALTGKNILRGIGRSRAGAGILVIMLFSILLMIVGYIGVFFCNWIKSCVSRQREFLADASSAQYTRNPLGLAGALKKIGGLLDGSFVCQVKAEEISHFFFSDGVSLSGVTIFPTHPPLELRIKLLDPAFDGKFPAVESIAPKVSRKYQARKIVPQLNEKAKEWQRKAAIFQLPVAAALQTSLADSVVSGVGVVTEYSLGEADRILEELPKLLRQAAASLSGAAAVIYGLLIERVDTGVRTRQLEYLSKNADPAVYQALLKLLPDFSCLQPEFCLPLLDLATPTLKTQSAGLYEVFRKHIEALILMDGRVTVFEFTLKQVVLHRLDFFFGKAQKVTPQHAALEPVLPSCEVLLSYLAGAGNLSKIKAEEAFRKAANTLAPERSLKFIPEPELTPQNVETSLKTMDAAFPKLKEQFLRACVDCVEKDGRLDVHEMELLRAFASTLDCPIPPFTLTTRA